MRWLNIKCKHSEWEFDMTLLQNAFSKRTCTFQDENIFP